MKQVGKDHVKMASAEKALFDTLYLAPGKTRLFAALPEMEIPRGFKWNEIQGYIRIVKSEIRRKFLAARVEELR